MGVATGSILSGVLSNGLLSSLPGLSLFLFDPLKIVIIILAVMFIAFLAGIESLLSALVADRMIGGRHRPNAELMAQAAGIRDAVEPDEILFVLDAMVGQDAVSTSTAFRDGVGFTGVVLSKLDGDARGGAALSVRGVTGAPVLFSSTGEGLGDFERFHADRMASRILDMGDVLTLIEQAERAFDKRQAAEMARKFMDEEDFTFDDFLQQMSAIKKMGNIKGLLGMMPGMGQMRDQLNSLDEREFDRVEAIVRSMTPFERTHPKQINGSRRARIARGSGVSVSEVNQLLQRFGEAQKMMRQLKRGGGMPGMPGMGAMPGGGGGKKAKSQPKKKGKSGNPAKRAQEEAAAAAKAEAARAAAMENAFGQMNDEPDYSNMKLPKGFEKFLGPGADKD